MGHLFMRLITTYQRLQGKCHGIRSLALIHITQHHHITSFGVPVDPLSGSYSLERRLHSCHIACTRPWNTSERRYKNRDIQRHRLKHSEKIVTPPLVICNITLF